MNMMRWLLLVAAVVVVAQGVFIVKLYGDVGDLNNTMAGLKREMGNSPSLFSPDLNSRVANIEQQLGFPPGGAKSLLLPQYRPPTVAERLNDTEAHIEILQGQVGDPPLVSGFTIEERLRTVEQILHIP